MNQKQEENLVLLGRAARGYMLRQFVNGEAKKGRDCNILKPGSPNISNEHFPPSASSWS